VKKRALLLLPFFARMKTKALLLLLLFGRNGQNIGLSGGDPPNPAGEVAMCERQEQLVTAATA
jgi:hypothetical protein